MAVLGSGSVGTDLMVKIRQSDGPLSVAAMVDGVDELLAMPNFADIRLVFDTTAPRARTGGWAALTQSGARTIDLTAATTGRHCVPVINLDDFRDTSSLHIGTGAGQAAVPIAAAIGRSGVVTYAETVCAVASRSAAPDDRAGVDEFIESTSAALQEVGGALRGKAVLLLSPADPPASMRSTVYCLLEGDPDREVIENDIVDMVEEVSRYVPGYRLKQRVQFETFGTESPLYVPEAGPFTGTRVTVMLEVTGAADHLPAYAGHLDMVTAAAKATAEHIALHANGTGS
ncbi:acetaldehyde dehydrogenase (acetylating) [Mycobacterium dioxanotrophicus]|uniref:Acetaldehyde dehydrogenase n=2 Tax=Mycobacterium TaxID=1763 RepID=A0A1Y0CEY9_9MYCO|nr:acetaldehyde dehydrogenase (acetylating) [Mycobacterium dioxanotrophicus]ORA33111.1 acetaldehyde dehydrogenase (acetylating) [Mycobacterium aquaticum]